MPKATVTSTTKKVELVSLPPDGYVEIKRLPYGASLERRDMVMTMKMSSEVAAKGTTQGTPEISTSMNNRAVTAFEWANCIVSWNLTNENALPLDWKAPNIFDIFDPAVEDELGKL